MKKILNFLFIFGFILVLASCSCGKKHTHDYETQYDSTGHWTVCECGDQTEKVSHSFTSSVTTEPGEFTKGVRTYTCSCGYSYTEEIDATHTHSYETKYDSEGHWTECSCGDMTQKVSHTFTDTETKAATEEAVGEMTHTCDCGYSYTTEIPKLNPQMKVTLNKTTFIAGQYLEYTEFKVEIYNGTTYDETTDFEFDLEGEILTTSMTSVTVTYGEYSKTLEIKVVDGASMITGIDILVQPGLVITNTSTLENIILVRKAYNDGTYSEYEYVQPSEIEIIQTYGILTLTVRKDYEGKTYTAEKDIENVIDHITFTKADKVFYTIGEQFDITGAQLTVVYKYGFDHIIEVNMDMVDVSNVNLNATGSYPVIITHDGVEYTYSVSCFKEATSIQMNKTLQSNEFTFGASLTTVANAFGDDALKVTYSDSTEDIIPLVTDMLSIDEWEMGVKTVTVSFLGQSTSFTINITSSGISVSEYYTTNPTQEFTIHGVVIGFNYTYVPSNTPTSKETIIKDESTSKWVVVVDLPICGIGDVIDFKATPTNDARKSITYTSNFTYEYHTEDPNVIQIDLSDAVTIYNNDQWKETFCDDLRDDTYGTVYKLHGNLRLVSYYTTTLRICFPEAMSYGFGDGKQYFNSTLSGVFRTQMLEDNTSYTAAELFHASSSYSTINYVEKDLYVINCGASSAYYNNFVILGDYCVKEMEPIVRDYTPQEKLTTKYLLGEDLILEGLTFDKNYVYGADAEDTVISSDMIETNIDKNTAGTYTVTITFEDGYKYTYEVGYYTELTKSIKLVCNEENLTMSNLNDPTTLNIEGMYIERTNTNDVTSNIPVTTDMISFGEIKYVSGYEIERTLYISYDGFMIDTKVKGTAKSITEAFTLDVGTTAIFKGVVVGYNNPGNNSASLSGYELVVKDPANNSIIAVTNTEKYSQGDVLLFVGTTAVPSGSTKDATRISIVAEKTSVIVAYKTTEKSEIELDLTQATFYSDHETFVSDFSDDNRANMIYKLVKFDVTLKGCLSYANIWRIFLPAETPVAGTGTGTGKQYFNSTLSAVIKLSTYEANTGLTASELLGNIKSWTEGPASGKYVYAVYMGSTGVYYGDFVVLGSYMVVGGAE